MSLTIPDIARRIAMVPQGTERDILIKALYQRYPSYIPCLKYANNPVQWVKDKLHEYTWSKQDEMMNSVRDNRRTAVHSCHRIGKTHIFARVAGWWIDTHPPGEAMVVTSAHTGSQVKIALWRELNRVHSKANLSGRMNQTEWYITLPNGKEEIVGFGRKPADTDGTAFQGTYAKYLLFLMDEGCYIPKVLLDAADTLVSNVHSRIVIFGNPDDPATEFARICQEGSGWNVIGVGYQETPNFSGESCPQEVKDMLISPVWVEEKRKKWGENSIVWTSKVLGRFPESSTDYLFPLAWIRRAQENNYKPGLPITLGVDVGAGGDNNSFCLSQGPVSRIIRRDSNPDTTVTLDNLLDLTTRHRVSSSRIDSIGVGLGATNLAARIAADSKDPRQNIASKVIGVDFRSKANDSEHYTNKRSEVLWDLRLEFERNEIDLDELDDDLANQLANIKYFPRLGKISIEPKDDIKARLGRSPDDVDSLALSRMKIVPEEEEVVKKRARVRRGRY